MTPDTLIINDSEGESDGILHDEPPVQLEPATIPFYSAPPFEINGYQPVPASGELRRKAIDEAHAALLLSATPASPTQIDSGSLKTGAKRRQTAHGRLEGGSEQDIYAFNALDDDDDFHPGSESKKRKRPPSEKKAPRPKKSDDSDGYEERTRTSRKKPAKRAKSTGRGMSVLDLLNDSSEDDWQPNTSKLPTSGKKSTRNNTVDTDLLPPLPKSKRKPRESAKTTSYYEPQQFDGNLTLGFNRSENPPNIHNTEIQVAATEPTPPAVASTFMIDLTHDELVLPHERRAEYDTLSPELSPAESPQHLPATNLGDVYDTPDLGSTIPDPPYDPNSLPSQLAIHPPETYAHMPEPYPLELPSVASDSPLSSLENSPVAKSAKKPKEKKRAATDQYLGLALAEGGDHGFGNFPVASEWRAAKGKARQGMAQATYAGRAKTSNAADLLAASGGGSDDDVWTGDGKAAQKKKKPAAKKRKGTANDDGDVDEEVMQKAKPKRKKSKPVETLVIGDSEDELSGGDDGNGNDLLGSVQVAATASAESLLNIPEKQMVIRLGSQKSQTPQNESYDTIAVNNSMLPAADADQLVSEEYRPPGLGAGTKKAHKWGRPKFLDEPIGGGDFPSALGTTSNPAATIVDDVPSPLDPVDPVAELLPELTKVTKKEAASAKRRKSKKDESEEEDWTGDPEPSRKPAAKKEAKAKTPRVTKKAAAVAAKKAKEQKEMEEQLSSETIKSSDKDEDLASVMIVSDPEPALPKKEPAKKEPKPKASKAAAKKNAEAITTSKETVSGTDEEEDRKGENATPVPELKPETKKEEPHTPSKKLTDKAKKTPHSPISKGPVKFRVGLSRRAHIEPLLKIIRK